MQRRRSGPGVEEVVAREATLARRLDTLRMLATMAGTTGVVAVVAATLAYRDLVTAFVAASPLVAAVVAMGWSAVTRLELRKVRLLLAVLGVERRDEGAAAAAAGRAARKGREERPVRCEPV